MVNIRIHLFTFAFFGENIKHTYVCDQTEFFFQNFILKKSSDILVLAYLNNSFLKFLL